VRLARLAGRGLGDECLDGLEQAFPVLRGISAR
jgi:hypothetical protein